MVSYSINIYWYNDIKNLGITANAEHITEGAFAGQVEVDILDETKFIKISKELGWMV